MESRQPRGLALVIGGVGGLDPCGFSMRRLARRGRLPCAVEVIGWGHGFGRWYADLTDVANHDRQAGRVVGSIGQFQPSTRGSRSSWSPSRAEPGSPSGARAAGRRSGGAGDPALAGAVAALRPDRRPRGIRREMVVFSSPLDVVILGAGTWLSARPIGCGRAAGPGGVRRARAGRAGRGTRPPVCQAPPDPMAAPDGGVRPPRRPLRRRHSVVPPPVGAPLLREGDATATAGTSRGAGGTGPPAV